LILILLEEVVAWPLAIVSSHYDDTNLTQKVWCMDCWNKKSTGENKKHEPKLVFQMVDFDEVTTLIEQAKKLNVNI
jgi:hypothetical protein